MTESEKSVVKTGICLWFCPKKGYGFVKQDDDPDTDMFLHWSNIEIDGFKTVKPNQRVEYEVGENSNGPQAINVKLLDVEEE